MNSKEVSQGITAEDGKVNGEATFAKAEDFLGEGITHCNKELIKEGIKLFTQAIELGLSPDRTVMAHCYLGNAFMYFWINEYRKDSFDLAISHFSFLSSAQGSFFDPNNRMFDPMSLVYAAHLLRHRYESFGGGNNDIQLAINYLNKAISWVETNSADPSEVYCQANHELGFCYHSLWRKNHQADDLDNSVLYHNRAIRVNNFLLMHNRPPITDPDVYYNCGNSLYDRWQYSHHKQDLIDAEKCVIASLDILKESEKSFDVYHLLRDIYNSKGMILESSMCTNTALYLLFSGKAIRRPSYSNISHLIPPSQLYDSLKYLQINKRPRSITVKDIEQFFPEMDFWVLLQYLNSEVTEFDVLRSTPVLMFYLGGIVSSFIIYDEDLDEKTNLAMTPQENYYYVRSAFSFFDFNKTLISADSILDYSITNTLQLKPTSSEDLYYLGQLYYFQALRTKDIHKAQVFLNLAKDSFRRSGNFVWAQAMLDAINGSDEFKSIVSDYIKKYCSNPKIISNNHLGSPLFTEQFSDYFHFNEVNHACPKYFSGVLRIGADIEFYKPLWEVFRFSKADYQQLMHKMRETVGKAIQKQKTEEILRSSMPITENDVARIQEDLVLFSHVEESEEVEQIAQLLIGKDFDDRNDMDILLRFLHNSKKIDDDQFFSLFKYNEYKKVAAWAKKDSDLFITGASFVIGLVSDYLIHDHGLSGLISGVMAILFLNIPVKSDSYEEIKKALWVIMNNAYLDEDQLLTLN